MSPAAATLPPRELFFRQVPTPLTRELREWIQTPLNPAAGASPVHSPTGQGLSRKKIWTTRRRKDGFPATGLELQEPGHVHKGSGPDISTPLTKEIRAWYGDPHDPTGINSRTPMLVANSEPMCTPHTRSPLTYNAAKLAKGFESLKGKKITDILPVGSILISSAPGVGDHKERCNSAPVLLCRCATGTLLAVGSYLAV